MQFSTADTRAPIQDMRGIRSIFHRLGSGQTPAPFAYYSDFPKSFAKRLAKSGKPLFVAVGNGRSATREDELNGSDFFVSMFRRIAQKSGPIELASGATFSGVPRFCGDIKSDQKENIFLFGWRTIGMRFDEIDQRYQYIVTSISAICIWEREVSSYFNMLGYVKHLNPEKKVMFLVFGGGNIALIEALYAMDGEYPVIIVNGSGRQADQLCINPCIVSKPNVYTVEFQPAAAAEKAVEILGFV